MDVAVLWHHVRKKSLRERSLYSSPRSICIKRGKFQAVNMCLILDIQRLFTVLPFKLFIHDDLISFL